MIEKKEIKRGNLNKNDNEPKRKNSPIFAMGFGIGLSKSEEIMIVDILDPQSYEKNVSSFSFVLTKKKAQILKNAIESFLQDEEDDDE